jgi:hypothetical protein
MTQSGAGAGWQPQVVEFVDTIVHNREEVTGLRAAARAAGVEVLGDRPEVPDLADQEGSGTGRGLRMVSNP